MTFFHDLTTCRVGKEHEGYTHVSLGPPTGAFYIKSSQHTKFLEGYCVALDRGEDLHLAERHRHIGPVVVDLDCRFKPTAEEIADPTKIRRRHSEAIEAIVQVYCHAIAELIETTEFDVYVTEKQGPIMDKGIIKDGIHLTVPSVITRPTLQLLLRKDVLGPLAKVFEPLELANAVEDVVDEAVIERNGWMMYGSKKPGKEPYVVTRRYHYTVRDSNEASEGSHSDLLLAGVGEERPKAEYVELLSIRNKFNELCVRAEQRDRAEEFVTKIEDEKKRKEDARVALLPSTSAGRCDKDREPSAKVQELLGILSDKRADAYDSWWKTGAILKSELGEAGFPLWIEFSGRSP